MMRWIIFACVLVAAVVGITLASLGYGYYAHREQLQPLFGWGERIIVKGRRELGLPTETHDMVNRIETTYLTLRGSVYLMPDQQFRNGGGMALWNDQLIVLHSSGIIMTLEEGIGLAVTGLPVPENNLEAYISLAAAEYPDQFPKEEAIRYNDIEFIDSEAFRGLVLSYTYIDIENRCYRTRVDQLPVPDTIGSIAELDITEDDWERLYESSPCLTFNETRELIVGYMAGGRLAFKGPDLLYLGNGEFHREGFYRPDAGIQSDDSDYGKTIEINLSTGTSRHYSKGHRNLQGITVDAQGRVWTTEHGMRGGDELNLVKDQENYGWPLENLGTLYSGIPAPTQGRVGRHDLYTAPVFAWLPSAAVSSLELVKGFHETWDGDLLIGSLRGRTLFRARIKDERIVFLEEIRIGQRIRDVMQIGPEKLALWLDTEEIVIFEIEPRKDPLEGLTAGLIDSGMSAESALAAQNILKACNECHSFEDNVQGAGPSLYNIVDRDIASTAFANYSPALRAQSGAWDVDTLTAYLIDPESVVPGTAMSGLGIGNPNTAAAVVKGLEWMQTERAPEL